MTLSSHPGGHPAGPPSSGARGPLPHARPSRPRPTDDEMVAIVAAIEMAWPRPVLAEDAKEEPLTWRFSGRWWSKPHTVQRSRPWVDRR